MKKIKLLLFFSCFLSFTVLGNIAQPGMWQAGGMGNYSLLFPEDSLAYKKIQMEKERISILLYPGFAVVKGEYWMKNTSDDSLNIRAGYPINSLLASRESRTLMQLEFDSLYGLKVLINGAETSLSKGVFEQRDVDFFDGENWYVWNNSFPKQSTTKVTVYFLMNTNAAQVLDGYERNDNNGFIYLLETGAIWKQPIVDGEIRMKMQGDLNIGDIYGLAPFDYFEVDKNTNILRSQFTNLSPSYEDNIVVSYGEELSDFDFAAKVAEKERWFEAVEQFSQQAFEQGQFMPHVFDDPFEVKGVGGVALVFYGILLFAGLLILLLIYGIYWKLKR